LITVISFIQGCLRIPKLMAKCRNRSLAASTLYIKFHLLWNVWRHAKSVYSSLGLNTMLSNIQLFSLLVEEAVHGFKPRKSNSNTAITLCSRAPYLPYKAKLTYLHIKRSREKSNYWTRYQNGNSNRTSKSVFISKSKFDANINFSQETSFF